jgi:hypothetical protein
MSQNAHYMNQQKIHCWKYITKWLIDKNSLGMMSTQTKLVVFAPYMLGKT